MILTKPLKGDHQVGGTFGPRQSFRLPDGRWTLDFHYGTDFPANTWTAIYAMHDGVVGFSGWDWSGYGGGHQVQVVSGGWSSYYLHMAQNPSVRVGQKVKVGQLLGYVGSTGASTGPHLHIELHRNGVAVDPEHYFTKPKPKPAPKPKPKPVPKPAPIIQNDEDEEMKLWIASVDEGQWYLVVSTGAGKANAVSLPGNSGMAKGGAAKAGIPVITLRTIDDLRKVANV